MGTLVEKAVHLSVQSLQDRDQELARQVIEEDDLVDRLEVELEERCMRLIALQQPLAGDLRTIGTVLKVITDLERVADYATNIAEMTVRLAKEPPARLPMDLSRMAGLTQRMLRESLDAFVNRDVELAEAVVRADDPVDEAFSSLYEELMAFVLGRPSEPQGVRQAIHLAFAARYLERIADHATNIAERVIYMVTGKRLAHQMKERILGGSSRAQAHPNLHG